MRIVHTIASLGEEHGGPSRSVPALCEALAGRGATVEVVVADRCGKNGSRAENVDPAVRNGAAFLRSPGRRSGFGRVVAESLRSDDAVVHDHGLWLASNHQAARVARRMRVPRIVSVRGMLTPWALAHRRIRKALAWRMYQHADLSRASAIHVTSTSELEAVRSLVRGVPLAMVPNGVELPAGTATMDDHGTRTALFLARLHPGKGARELIDAWGQIRPAGWRLVVAGPDVDGHRAELELAASAADLSEVITFTGAVDDREKWDLYLKADLFVLPTRSENFGLSIAEALAAGLPVITTRGAPWPELEQHGCGWWIHPDGNALRIALEEAVRLDRDVRRSMGERGRRLVRQRYAWESVAERMLSVYRWLLHGGAAPADVAADGQS